MKKFMVSILSFICIFALSGCSADTTTVSIEDVLKKERPFCYISDENVDFSTVKIADVPPLFDPNDTYMTIQRYTMVDLDGDNCNEAVLFVCGVAGDSGGYLILHEIDGQVYGYRTDYRKFENLKTDGSFFYSDNSGSKEAVARISFSQDGLIITDTMSATGEAFIMKDFMINGKECTQEEYYTEIEKQSLNKDVQWHEYSTC